MDKDCVCASLRQGIIPIGAYRLQDMAQDVVNLLNYLNIDKAHIVAASDHKDTVLCLDSGSFIFFED